MYMPVPTQRLMIFSDPMFPSLRVKCLMVGFGGGPAPRWLWEVLNRFDSEVAAWVSGAAETVDYFG